MSKQILVEFLVEAEDNPNHMDPARYDLLVHGMQTHGFLEPMLVAPRPDGRYNIVGGHHRLRAAKQLGMKAVPCVVKDMTVQEQAALRLAMNRLRGDVDIAKARDIVTDLANNHGWDITAMASTGFTVDELTDLLAAQHTGAEDILEQAASMQLEDEETQTPNMFVLEVAFNNKADYVRARKLLRRAAGKGGELALGLMRLLGEE